MPIKTKETFGIKFLEKNLVDVFILVFTVIIVSVAVPGEPFLVKLDHNLRTLVVGLTRRYQIGFIARFPVHIKR